MLVRDSKRLAFFVGPVLLFLYIGFNLSSHHGFISIRADDSTESALGDQSRDSLPDAHKDQALLPEIDLGTQIYPQEKPDNAGEAPVLGKAPESTHVTSQDAHIPASETSSPQHEASDDKTIKDTKLSGSATELNVVTHHEVFASSTTDKKFFLINFGDVQTINPNIIPHPTLENTWIVVAQRRNDNSSNKFVEVFCNAVFKEGSLRCLDRPGILPVAATPGGQCEGDWVFVNSIFGPHDARVLFGPDYPFIVYGSNSRFTCLGQFMQDFRVLVDDWPEITEGFDFRIGTDLQRPPPWSNMEKNWFPFWNSSGQMLLHYDVAPKRVFAEINADGSAGPDLAPSAAALDDVCMAKYLPQVALKDESIHQATNSLRITMCRRINDLCIATDDNTFIFTIYQHKKFHNFHSVYEPYIMVFKQRAPYEIHAMSRLPLWIHGREKHHDEKKSDMFYVTSMNWKQRDLRYHGYLDDELFLAFGIEDEKTGGMDVLAGDLLGNLGLCSDI